MKGSNHTRFQNDGTCSIFKTLFYVHGGQFSLMRSCYQSQIVVTMVLSCGWKASSETDGKCLAFGNCVLFLNTKYR